MTYGYKFEKTYFKTLPHYHKLNTVERCIFCCLRTFIYAFYNIVLYHVKYICIHICSKFNRKRAVIAISVFIVFRRSSFLFLTFFLTSLLLIRNYTILNNCIHLVNVEVDVTFLNFELDAI